MPSLYDLADDMLKIEAMMEESDGDESMLEALTEALDDQTETFENKANGIFALLRNWEAFGETIKMEENRLAARRKTLENRAKWLRGYLLAHMQRTKKTKVELPLGMFTVAKGRESVLVKDDMALPQGYFETQTSIKPDKTALKKLWDETPEDERDTLPGFSVERGADSLRMK